MKNTNRNVLKRSWHHLSTELKERWPDLTQSDLEYINGDEAKLIEVVEKRRHVTPEEARRDVEFFIDKLPPQKRPA